MDIYRKFAKQIVEGAVGRIASGVADKTAHDADDYRQLFYIKFWQASKSVPDQGQGAYVGERWIFTSVRNQLRSCQRMLGRHPELARYDLLPGENQCGPNFERKMELQDLLWKLCQAVTEDEWQLLLDYVAHGCNVTSVWDAYNRPGSKRGFYKIIYRLRMRCQKIIERIG